jgi:IS30 family transposase
MEKHYRQLSLEERCQIAELRRAGQSLRQIAAALDRAASSISRELRRNCSKQVGYKPVYAQQQAWARRWTGSRLERDADLRSMVLGRLKGGWSPEQIAGFLKSGNAARRISHESIYRFIYAQIRRTNDGSWRHYLPRAKHKRGRRPRPKRSSANCIKGRVSIAERPAEIERRESFGHWEADLMLFATPGQAVLVSLERKSRALLSAKQPGKAALPAAKRLISWFKAFDPRMRNSVTFDNGTEFARHQLLVDKLGVKTFFCDTHSPWQKGAVENAIGRLRRFFPRKTDLQDIDSKTLDACIAAYNNTPRKCLGFQTPAQVLLTQLLHFKCESSPSLRSG